MQEVLGVTEKHLKDTVVLSPRQHKFLRGKSCLTNFFAFYNELSHLVDLGKPAEVIFWDFSQALDTASRSIYPAGQNVAPTARSTHRMMGEQLAEGSGSKGYGKWGSIRLLASH